MSGNLREYAEKVLHRTQLDIFTAFGIAAHDESRPIFLLVGKNGQGKTTFLNTLLGQPLLPTGATPTTSRITTVSSSPVLQVSLELNGHRSNLNEVELGSAATTHSSNERLEVLVPFAIDLNAVIIDTPGIGGAGPFKLYDDYRELFETAAVVFVVTSLNRPISDGERAAISLAVEHKCTVVAVVTHCDKVDDSEDLSRVSNFHRDVLTELGCPNATVIMLPEPPDILRQQLESVFDGALLKPAVHDAKNLVSEALRKRADTLAVKEVERSLQLRKIASLEAALSATEDDEAALRDLAARAYNTLSTETESELQSLFAEAKRPLKAECKDYQFVGSAGKAKFLAKTELKEILDPILSNFKSRALKTFDAEASEFAAEASRRGLNLSLPSLEFAQLSRYEQTFQEISNMRESPGFLWSNDPSDFAKWFVKRLQEIQQAVSSPMTFAEMFKLSKQQHITNAFLKIGSAVEPARANAKTELAVANNNLQEMESGILQLEAAAADEINALQALHNLQVLAFEASWFIRTGNARAALWRCRILAAFTMHAATLYPLMSALRILIYSSPRLAEWLTRGSDDDIGRSLSPLLKRKLSNAP